MNITQMIPFIFTNIRVTLCAIVILWKELSYRGLFDPSLEARDRASQTRSSDSPFDLIFHLQVSL